MDLTKLWSIGLVVAVVAIIALPGCATGVRGSPRRICADAGHQPGTQEFTACWHGVRDRMFAEEAVPMTVGLVAGVAANTRPPPAPPVAVQRGFATLARDRVSGMNRICTYNTARGEYTITIPSYDLCPLNPR